MFRVLRYKYNHTNTDMEIARIIMAIRKKNFQKKNTGIPALQPPITDSDNRYHARNGPVKSVAVAFLFRFTVQNHF